MERYYGDQIMGALAFEIHPQKIHGCVKINDLCIAQFQIRQFNQSLWFILCSKKSHTQRDEGVEGWLSLQPNVQKGALGRISIFRGRLLGMRGLTFFKGGCSFYIRNKRKSEIFKTINVTNLQLKNIYR